MVDQQALSGWHVEIDGEAADELTVDGLFLGVLVPAGDHVVEWRYASPLLTESIVVSILAAAATLALALSGILGAWAGRRRGPHQSAEPDQAQVGGVEHR